ATYWNPRPRWQPSLCNRQTKRSKVLAQVLVVIEVVLDWRKPDRNLVLFKVLRRSRAGARRRIALEPLRIGQGLAFGPHEPPHVELAGVGMGRAVGHDVSLARHIRPDLLERHEPPRLVLHHDQALQVGSDEHWKLTGNQKPLTLGVAISWS